MRIILARCSALYTGKISTELELGDWAIIIKDDGTVLIQDSKAGIKPKNWMPAGSEINKQHDGKVLIIENKKSVEKLEIFFDQIIHDLV